MSPRLFVVVPTYNEKENIAPLIQELMALPFDLDVCVADDGSPDGTADAVREAALRFPGRVSLLSRPGKGGRGAAVILGFRQGLAAEKKYDFFFEMDADFSHHPREIPKLVEKLSLCDMVIGSRYVPGGGTSEWGLARPLLSFVANLYVQLVAGVPVRDTTSGYRAYKRAVLEEMAFDRIRVTGYAVHGEIAYQAWVNGFRLGEVPIHFKNRARDTSKLSFEEVYMAVVNFSLLRFRYGFRPRRRNAA